MKLLAILSLAALPIAAPAQDKTFDIDPTFSLKLDTRFDGEMTTYGHDADGSRPETESGYVGSYLKILVEGQINSHFSYHFRHRLYKEHGPEQSLFNATDWAYLTYSPDSHWHISAGKQVVLVGGFEYDAAPIDVYFASDFWNHVGCYQNGLTVSLTPDDRNTLSAQMTNSIHTTEARQSLYAYSLYWSGRPAPWLSTLWSVNMTEYARGHYTSYISLGQRLHLDPLTLDIDYMNRYAGGAGNAFFEDFSLVCRADLRVARRWNIFAKGGIDRNRATRATAAGATDLCVAPGTDRKFYGAGVEYFPIDSDRSRVRIHAAWHSSTDKPTAQNFLVGLRWRMSILDWRKSQ